MKIPTKKGKKKMAGSFTTVNDLTPIAQSVGFTIAPILTEGTGGEMIPQRWDDFGPGSMRKSKDGLWCIFTEAEKWVAEREHTISRLRSDLCDRGISLEAALKLCKQRSEEIAALIEEGQEAACINNHNVEVLSREIAALKEELKEAYSKNEKLLLFIKSIATEGQHDPGSNKLCDCVLCRIIRDAAKECI